LFVFFSVATFKFSYLSTLVMSSILLGFCGLQYVSTKSHGLLLKLPGALKWSAIKICAWPRTL